MSPPPASKSGLPCPKSLHFPHILPSFMFPPDRNGKGGLRAKEGLIIVPRREMEPRDPETELGDKFHTFFCFVCVHIGYLFKNVRIILLMKMLVGEFVSLQCAMQTAKVTETSIGLSSGQAHAEQPKLR